MKTRLSVSMVAVAALAACGAPPGISPPPGNLERAAADHALSLQPPVAIEAPLRDRQVYPDGHTFRLLAVEELPIVGVTADSEQAGLSKSRMIDGDLATQWASGGYRNATAWAAVELAAAASIASISVKSGPSNGTAYDIQTSADGINWTTRVSGVTNTTWQLETKALPAGTTGRFVRLFWRNNATNPQARFTLFELVVNGEAGAMPSPSPVASPTPTPTPTATPTAPPTTSPTPGPLSRLRPTALSASSTYTGLVPERAVDGDVTTQWASGEYKASQEWLMLSFDQRYGFDNVRIKTGYLPDGVTYSVDVSNDGVTWRVIASGLRNTSWNMETKPLSGEGQYMRVRFTNDWNRPIARFTVFELEVFGKANPSQTIKTLYVDPMVHNALTGGSGVCINGSWETLINVQGEAFNNTPKGYKFDAMLHLEYDRLGRKYGRITPQNAGQVFGDIGGCGGVSFLDDVNGLGDNSGSWVFTHRSNEDEVYPIEASAAEHVLKWDPARAHVVDLGDAPRNWSFDFAYLQPWDGQEGLVDPHSPGVAIVYTRPDGVRDFTLACNNPWPDGGPRTFQAVGRAYIFSLAQEGEQHTEKMRLTLQSLD